MIIVITGSVDTEGGMWVNAGWFDPLEQRAQWNTSLAPQAPKSARSRPDLPMWLGEVPCAAMVDEIESGHLKALFINGGSPLTAFPEPDRMLAALRSLELLVVVDVMANELTEIATHVLPAAALLERSDLPGGWSQHMGYTAPVVPMGGDRAQDLVDVRPSSAAASASKCSTASIPTRRATMTCSSVPQRADAVRPRS